MVEPVRACAPETVTLAELVASTGDAKVFEVASSILRSEFTVIVEFPAFRSA